MDKFLKKFGVLLIILVLAWQAMDHYKTIGPDNQVLRADGKAYYAYLPAVFIYHDNQFNFIDFYEHKYNHPDAYADFRNKINGVFVNKYYAGVAILQLPFFLVAHVVSRILKLPADGYAPLYQQFFVIGSLFYLYIGMYCFFLYLVAWKLKPWVGLFVLICLLFGTNAYHYSVYEQCMSHIYSLSLFGIFIYGAYRVIHTTSTRWLAVSLTVLGMITIIRPVNLVIVAFIPFIAGSWINLKSGILFAFRNIRFLLIGIAGALIPFIIQSILWHWQTGDFFVYSYGNEAMEWANPKIRHILFSYRKGWFVWTPLAFIGVLGLFIFSKDFFRFFSVLIFIVLVIYILSCWWTPDYGMSFGAREFIEFLFVPAIGLAALINRIKPVILKAFLIIIGILGIYVNQVQARQYRDHIILWDGMNKQKYWRVFLHTSPGYYYWLEEVAGFNKPELITDKIDKSYTNEFEEPSGWQNENQITDKMAHSGNKSNYIDASHKRSAVFIHQFTSSELQNDSLVQASVWFYGPQPDYTSLFMRFENNGKEIAKPEIRIRKYADENYHWNRAILQVAFPNQVQNGTILSIYADNEHNNDLFYLDDFRIDFIKK